MSMTSLSYALVTPARNEAENIRRLAASIDAQTVRPQVWIVVDNGSDDGTAAIAEELAASRPWLRVLETEGEPVATRGGPVAKAFMESLPLLDPPVDVVVKLDADVSFEPTYFEELLARFAADPELGIASGTCFELEGGEWKPQHVTGDRVRGATRAYRLDCLQDVLPLENLPGWDGIDEVKAIARGWRTTSFRDLGFLHHRKLASRDESRRQRLLAVGRANYYIGYRPSYLILRALFKARREPVALALIVGYAGAALRREPRCTDTVAREYLRGEQQLRRLPLRARERLGHGAR